MAKLLKLRRGTTSQHSSFTGAEGELTVDTTKDTAVVHDGSTAGGRPLLREDLDNMPASGVSAGTYGSSSAIPALTVDVKGRVTGATTTAIDSTAITNGSASVAVASNGPITATGNLVVTGTVDGRDVAADGTKLDGIESGATGDQTAAEIRSLVESASDSNVFTDADHSKLNGIESGATGDQSATEILNAIKTVDGSGSGLDADLLDGQSSAYYLNASNLNAGTISASRLPVINSVPTGAIFLWSGAANALPTGYVLCNGSNSTPNLQNRFVVGAGDSYAVDATGGANTITIATADLPSHTHSTGNHSHGVNDHAHSTPNHSHGVNSHTHSTPNHSHGVNSHSHSTPNHNHNMNSHSHSGNTSNTGGHSHNTTFYNAASSRSGPNDGPQNSRRGNSFNRGTNNTGAHNHSFNTGNAASNTNTSGGGNTGNAGANTSNSGGSNTGGAGANTSNSGGSNTGNAGANTSAVSAGTTGSTGGGTAIENRPLYYALCYIMKT